MTKMKLDNKVSTIIQNRIISLLDTKDGSWVGSVSELDRAITTGRFRSVPENWPSTPSVFRRALNTVAPSLRRSGVRMVFTRATDHFRKRLVSFVQR